MRNFRYDDSFLERKEAKRRINAEKQRSKKKESKQA